MSKHVGKFSLEEIMCPNEIKHEDDKTDEKICYEVKDLLSKIQYRIGIVTFNHEITLENTLSETISSEVSC